MKFKNIFVVYLDEGQIEMFPNIDMARKFKKKHGGVIKKEKADLDLFEEIKDITDGYFFTDIDGEYKLKFLLKLCLNALSLDLCSDCRKSWEREANRLLEKMKNKNLTYTCPYCDKEQLEIGQKQKGSKWYGYDLEEKSYRVWYEFEGEIEKFYCLECGEMFSLEEIVNILPERSLVDLGIID